MKVPANGLLRLLARETPPVAWLLVGPEVPRVLDAAELVRAHFRKRGIGERALAVADRGFDWEDWLAARANRSLFTETLLAEVRLLEPAPTLGRLAPRLLATAGAETPLLVTAFSLEKTFRTGAFYRAWAEHPTAGLVEIWPLRSTEWPTYVGRLARGLPRPLARESLTLLARATEGNVQALRDAIERLKLLVAPGAQPLLPADVAALLDDEPRIGAFDFAEAVLTGDLPSALRRLAALERMGAEPLLVVGALVHRLRAEILPSGPRPSPDRRPPSGSGSSPAAARRWRDLVRLDRNLKSGGGLPPWRELEGLVRAWLAPARSGT